MKNYSKRKIVLLAALQMLLVLGFMPGDATAQNFPKPGNSARGAKLWANNCGRCHNIRSPQDLSDTQWITTAFHMRVRAGLIGQDTRDILTFLQSTNSSGVTAAAPAAGAAAPSDAAGDTSDKKNGETVQASLPAGDAGAGKALFAENCSACHGADGRGGDISGVPNLSSRMGKSNGALIRSIKQGRQTPGAAMAMPPWPDLSDAEVRSLVAYLRSSLG